MLIGRKCPQLERGALKTDRTVVDELVDESRFGTGCRLMFGVHAWVVGAIANAVIAGCYFGISGLILRGLLQTGQLRSNRLASATSLIFFTCAVHHGSHTVHMLLPLVIHDQHGLYMRQAFSWQMDAWDIFGALVAIVYLSLRSSYGRLLATPSMYLDLERERAQAAVAAERAALAEAQAVAKLGSWSFTVGTAAMSISAEYRRLLALPDSALQWNEDLTNLAANDRGRLAHARELLLETGTAIDETVRIAHDDGEETILQVRGRLETDPITGGRRATGTAQDITERTRSELARQAAEERFRVAFAHAGVPMAIVGLEGDERGVLLDANAAYAALLELTAEQLIGAQLERWIHPGDQTAALDDPLERLGNGGSERLQYERRYLLPDGRVISAVITDAVLESDRGERFAIEQALDITDRKSFEGQLQHLADHDALTGLFNRRRFDAELERALAHARRFGTGGAVLALDLDGFKFVNDALGHAAGDSLVIRLAGTLQRTLRETDVVARSGGDEFTVILPGLDEREACVVAEKLLSAIRRAGTMLQEQRHAQVTTSIGITTFEGGEDVTAEDLLIEADIAMYDAKHAGKDCLSVYRRDHRRRERIAARQDWLARLRQAVEEERFVLHAQPIVPVCSNGVPRYELLLRMSDAHGDLISPGTFLYNAERFGFIERIDQWVMAQAVAMLEREHARGNQLSLAVNMSAKTLNGGRAAEHLAELLRQHTIPEGRLVVEITETAAISNMDLARDLARDLRALGARIALDDFGAGFATFYYLKHLDFDFVKIDGEFIRHLPDNRADQLVVRSVVDIARGLGADTIAEFVQDDRTLELLRSFGVGYAQGYHTGRPGPASEVIVLPAQASAGPETRS